MDSLGDMQPQACYGNLWGLQLEENLTIFDPARKRLQKIKNNKNEDYFKTIINFIFYNLPLLTLGAIIFGYLHYILSNTYKN